MKFKILVICILLLVIGFEVKAEENTYHLVNAIDGQYEKVEDFNSFSYATRSFRNLKEDYSNLVLLENDKVILMEYGIVEFKVNNGCTYNIDYNDYKTDENRYLNGCYGIDAAYINSSRDTNDVYFQIAGSLGYTDLDNVILHPIDNFDMRISSYSVKDGDLYHDIKTQLKTDFYSASILISKAPEYLVDNSRYFSYDGHYFYNDFKLMIDDLKNEVHGNAINVNNPFYNYYAYIPHRSLSNYSYDDIDNYLTEKLGFNKKLDSYFDLNYDNANDEVNRSQYVGEVGAFIENQYIYGANALMMLSLSMNESAYGKSSLAYGRNNLFGHAAFDSDVERNASRYLNISTSVYSHAKYYIGDRYSNPLRSTYYGSYFGDKQSGMNVMYASDPYWGEKAANYYYRLDKALGLKDANSYALGIIENNEDIIIYEDDKLQNQKLIIEDICPYSMIILEELADAYKVQLDPNYSDDNCYSFIKSVGYVDKNVFNYILNEDKIESFKYHEITFDLNGGKINGQDKIKYLIKEGQLPALTAPIKEGYEFIGFDHELLKAYSNDVYVAEYKKINSIEIASLPPRIIEYNYRIDLTDGKIKVNYEDGSHKVIDINTNMISGYDLKEEGVQEVMVSYCGLATSYEIEVSKKLDDYRTFIDENLDDVIDNYLNSGTYDKQNVLDIVDKLYQIEYRLSDKDIRILDRILLDIYKDDVNFYIKENRFDANISGMALALDVKTSLKNKHFLYKDTYLFDTTVITGDDYLQLKEIGKAYDFEVADSFRMSFKRNAVKLDVKLPIIVQLKIKDIEEDKLYTVYRIDDNGDIEKCRTSRTKDYIEFTTDSDGSFMVLSMESKNIYNLENIEENLSYETDGIDLNQIYVNILRVVVIGLLCAITIVYYRIQKGDSNKKWKDYKKSLRNAELHQEEKPKN